MYCLHCGQQLPPDAFFCPNCGEKVETSANAPITDASAPKGCADGDATVKIETYMDYAIAITVLGALNCGFPFNLVLGIVAIYYASKSDQYLRSGDYKKAKDSAQTAKMLCFIAIGILVFTILCMLLCFTLMLLLASNAR